MKKFNKAWLSYEMKALTNDSIWSKITIVTGQEEMDPVGNTAANELTKAADQLFSKGLTQFRKHLKGIVKKESGIDELKKASGCEEGIVLLYEEALSGEGLTEGYRIISDEKVLFILSGAGRGILYGAFDVIRTEIITDTVANLSKTELPDNPLRMLNHWDNMDGSIERGYSGKSFFFADDEILVDERTREYARLCASVGLNATVINNVNVKQAATELITARYEDKLCRMADIFAEYGVTLFLSLNFAAPIELGGLPVSDPLDPSVIAWWKERMAKVFTAIPKLGGFLVKADSEGRPGPHTYGRTQAEGANMLAREVAPYGGKIIWRCFVYNCSQDWRDQKTDRARAGYDYFKPLDGMFDENVVLQIKNGPMDFQVREPISPLLGGLKNTNQMLEVQAAQEYTGQQRHLCYLIPMWKEVLSFRTYCTEEKDTAADIVSGRTFHKSLCGMAAVANTGDDINWTGHDFAQLNFYGFGRLAFSTSLSAEEIAREWFMMTVTKNKKALAPLLAMALSSWDTYEKYTSPLGIGWMVNPSYHYGPNVDGYEYDRWGTYHRANCHGLGVDRTSAGTGYAEQYNEPNRSMYESMTECPEELLLFFHKVRYDYVLKTGKTLLQHIYDTHFEGAETAEKYLSTIESCKDSIPTEMYERIHPRFVHQAEHAKEWRDRINTYFYRMSGVPDEKGRKIYE